jgi:hypothetical protein
MLNKQRVTMLLVLGMLGAMAPPTWADRDSSEGKIHREQSHPQRPPEVKGGRVEAPGRDHQTPPVRVQPSPPAHPVRAPAPVLEVQPVLPPAHQPRPPQPVRKVQPVPDKSHQVVPARQVAPVPAPKPIKDWKQETKIQKEPPKPGWVLDTKYKHNHYYPPRGHVVPVLPPAHHVIRHHHQHYHYHHGIWYLPHGTSFIVVVPPFGLLVPILPPFYTTVWVNSTTYYYAGGVYYSWWPAYQQYVVVEPPPEEKVRAAPNGGSDQLFIYPAAGQSEEQQARDRYECHRWAQGETGFDPTAPGGGVPAAQHASKRADYFRAMKACLEARHYSVQ